MDKYGILKALAEGGYSDDMIFSARCAANGLKIAVARSAVFPSVVEPGTSLWKCWMYITRQVVTLDTYHDFSNRVINHSVWVAHFILPLVEVLGTYISLGALLLHAARFVFDLGTEPRQLAPGM